MLISEKRTFTEQKLLLSINRPIQIDTFLNISGKYIMNFIEMAGEILI